MMKSYIIFFIAVLFSACSVQQYDVEKQRRNPVNFYVYKQYVFFESFKKAYADNSVEDVSGLLYAEQLDSRSRMTLDSMVKAYITELLNVDPSTVADYGGRKLTFAAGLGLYESQRLDSLVSLLVDQTPLKRRPKDLKSLFKDYAFWKTLEEGYKYDTIENDATPAWIQDGSGFSIVLAFAEDLNSISTHFVASIPEVSPGKKAIFRECLAFYKSSALDHMIKKQMRIRGIKRERLWDL